MTRVRARAWTTPADVAARVQRAWDRGHILSAQLTGESPFPMRIPLSAPSATDLSNRFDESRAWIRALEEGSRDARGKGYVIEWKVMRHRQLGLNRVPARLVVPTEADGLVLIKESRAADRFRELVEQTFKAFPNLREWLARYPHKALAHADDWSRILATLSWFRENPRSDLYLRQLDIEGVDSKFIESRKRLFVDLLDRVLPAAQVNPRATGAKAFEARYGLRDKPTLVRFRILDDSLFIAGLSDLTVPATEFAQLAIPARRVFITENEINGLAFPPHPHSLVIFGLGYGLERLATATWLSMREVYYWGDVDTHGFAMLDRLRAIWPHTRSFLMDRNTLLAHHNLWGSEADNQRCLAQLERLDGHEAALYDDLRSNRLAHHLRLEQERISFAWVNRALTDLRSPS